MKERLTLHAELGEATFVGRKTPATELPRFLVFFRWFVGGAGLIVLALLFFYQPPQRFSHFLLFVAMVILGEVLFSVRVAPGSQFSIAAPFILVYFLLAGGMAAAIVEAVARIAIWAILSFRKMRAETFLFVAFNVGQAIFSILAGSLMVRLILWEPVMSGPVTTSPILALCIFAVTYFIVSSALLSATVFFRAGFSEVQDLWRTTTTWAGISILTTVPFAILLVLLSRAIGYVYATVCVFVLLAGIALIIRLNVDLRRGNNELKVVNSIGNLINATLDISELFRILARESRRVLNWDGFFIATVQPGASEIQIVFMTGAGAEIAQRAIPVGAGLTGKAIATGELVHYERSSTQNDGLADDTGGGDRKPRSIVVAPMKFGSDVIGALSVQSFRMDAYGTSHFRLLQTIASQAAIALRNAQLFRSEQAAQSERDEFLSLVTHEIKNPLTSIRGYSEIAEQSMKERDQDAAIEAIGVIRSESMKILRLAEDLLDASKMTAGRFTVKLQPVDLAEITSQVVGKYAATSSHQIEIQLKQQLPIIEADPLRLSQVIENLISNAVKYSPPNSLITVILDASTLGVRLAVKDTGFGIPAEKLPLVFERFYRVEEADGHIVKGTGLGLFISREIVHMHGGSINVDSAVGKGSVFTVELPVSGRHESGASGSLVN